MLLIDREEIGENQSSDKEEIGEIGNKSTAEADGNREIGWDWRPLENFKLININK